jgi:hypothetical protein
MISSVLSGDERVTRLRRRPKDTSSKARTTRAPFGKDESVKELSILMIADEYNYNIGTVNEFDHLTAQNASLRHVKRGHQALGY